MLRKTGGLAVILAFCTGCQAVEQSSTDTMDEPMESYRGSIENLKEMKSFDADVECHYTMQYPDDTKDSFDLNGTLKQNGETAYFTQEVNSNGAQFEMEGYYLDGRMYNSYNDICYYEDMDYGSFLETLLVPFDPADFSEDQIQSITGEEKEDGSVIYEITLNSDVAGEIFTDRYDVYGLNEYDDYTVKKADVKVSVKDGYVIDENTVFVISVSYQSTPVAVEYACSVSYEGINQTEVRVDEETEQKLQSYVNYKDIDTEGSEENADLSVTEIFRKAVVDQLGYVKRDDGTYRNEFNSNEMYQIDFENCTFTYARYSIAYVYNWKNDSASSSTCNYNFQSENGSTGCDASVIESMKAVKEDLQMELFYCGLSLDDLRAEARGE
ncbi:MAG: hypothetical protein ACI32N_02390 [Bulleidia sp.]